jgi:hypothetical protein
VVVKSSAFEVIHSQWMEEHLSKRKGEGKRRLRVGHGHAEKEVVRLAMRLNRAVKLSDVESAIQCGYRLAHSTMNRLVEKHGFIPDGGGQIRTHSWKLQLNEHQIHSLLFL